MSEETKKRTPQDVINEADNAIERLSLHIDDADSLKNAIMELDDLADELRDLDDELGKLLDEQEAP